MEIHLYGCGFAGLVSTLGLRKQENTVHATDSNPDRVHSLNQGVVPWRDSHIEELLHRYQGDRLHFYQVGEEPVETEAVIIAVPTPHLEGGLSLSEIENCLNHIERHIRWKGDPLILIRSTLPVHGTQRIRESVAGWENTPQIVYFPEFMREGTGLEDWDRPPLLVIGCDNEQPSPKIDMLLAGRSYRKSTSTEAEILKLASNAFHATKVSFANELMRICEPIGVSSETVMDLFCLDTKLNLSEKYLTPGFAWGGPCLGKDIRSLVALSPNLPLLNSLEESNSDHIEFFKEKILEKKPRRVAMIGLSFKPEVNDTRSSPILRLAESLALAPQIEAIVLFDPSADSFARRSLNGRKFQWVGSLSELKEADILVVRKNFDTNLTAALKATPCVEI